MLSYNSSWYKKVSPVSRPEYVSSMSKYHNSGMVDQINESWNGMLQRKRNIAPAWSQDHMVSSDAARIIIISVTI